ncbi:MAG TPA: tRNA pseudouridine(38-40) synthase TruA, partial [bacterium]|nr:tRNA pseudouridine(38-40) synthase TruA [bacterium]
MQVVSFEAEKIKISLYRLQKALNYHLPSDIRVKITRKALPGFHPRFSAKEKTYRYYVCRREVLSPFLKDYVYHFPYKLDQRLMKSSLYHFGGRRDFRAFQASGSSQKTTTCNMKDINIRKTREGFYIEITADRFLYKMARKIAGTIIETGRKKISLSDMEHIFAGKIKPGATAPAQGLFLWKISY